MDTLLQEKPAQEQAGKKFMVNIEYPWERDTISVAEIRVLGHLPTDLPVIEVFPDGKDKILVEDEVVDLKLRHNHVPKFKAGKIFYVNIEGVEYPWLKDTITVPEIRELGHLPKDQPVVEEFPDGKERTLNENDVIKLKPGHRFGRAPKFKRGLL